MANIVLDTKLVGDITGDFIIPEYQRGYRWGKEEITRLLDDIYDNGAKSYCLQPIVVKRSGDKFELVDGQQRLTSLYLIYKYMNHASGGFIDDAKFTLTYVTREKSSAFLNDIDLSLREDNIDFYFIAGAYETIENWFAAKEKKSTLTNINKYFDENVKVIWYEVDDSEDAIALFARLNIGKIALTSAELIKAMFLSKDNNANMSDERQQEISLQWDNIERELHDDSLWYFLINYSKNSYQTRIDLVLDLNAKKPEDTREKYYTFFKFDEMRKTMALDEIWRKIQKTFLILKDWYENHELYHKIGYLIASQANTLSEIYALSENRKKSEFRQVLDKLIRESLKLDRADRNYGELSYEKDGDRDRISSLLLLFNVESVRTIDAEVQRFPFDKFKYDESGEVTWSLEHIHAQHSQGLRNEKDWREWLSLHLDSIRSLGFGNEELIQRMENLLNSARIDRSSFEELQSIVEDKLSEAGNIDYLHRLSNMALLNCGDNAALNNSTFDVKRNIIIDMDKKGKYIPYCTKMVFFKYYTPSSENQLHFWGAADRKAYIKAINEKLKGYLPAEIVMEKEAE